MWYHAAHLLFNIATKSLRLEESVPTFCTHKRLPTHVTTLALGEYTVTLHTVRSAGSMEYPQKWPTTLLVRRKRALEDVMLHELRDSKPISAKRGLREVLNVAT